MSALLCLGPSSYAAAMIDQHSSPWLPRLLGAVLTIASFGFIGLLLWSQRSVIAEFRPGLHGLLLLATGTIVFCVAGWLQAVAWRLLLHWSGEERVCRQESRRIYARTQIAKYVPGNVMQLLGRHVLGREAGWSHTGLLLSGVFEMLTILAVSSLMALIGLGLTGIETGLVNLPMLLAVVAVLAAGGYLVLRIVPRLVLHKWPELTARLKNRRLSGLVPVAAIHAVYFVLGGLSLLIVCNVVLETSVDPKYWPAVFSLFAIAWTAGVITPGAPSGLGVREAVLVLGLNTIASSGDAVLIAGLLRLQTVSGDVLFFMLGSWKGPEKSTQIQE